MTQQERNRRRALIVRRQTAQRMSRVQLEIWRKRKAAQAEALDDADCVGEDGLLADLPEGLLS